MSTNVSLRSAVEAEPDPEPQELPLVAALRTFSHWSGGLVLKGQRQDFEILDLGKAACTVELERRNVAGVLVSPNSSATPSR
jgi:hypothetical protein